MIEDILWEGIKWPCLYSYNIEEYEIGMKANRLNKMHIMGYKIPLGFVITPHTFEKIISYNNKTNILSDLLLKPRLTEWHKITGLIDNLNIPTTFLNAIREMTIYLKWPLVVRSSSLEEDTKLSSKAGIYKSVIKINNTEELIKALKTCWAASFSPLAEYYNCSGSPIPLIIEDYIETSFSGVAFSNNLIFDNNDDVIISSTEGGVEGLVSGEISGSIFIYSRKDKKLIVADPKISFSNDLVEKVVNTVLSMEKQFDNEPLDIEWGMHADTMWIFQSRPITSLNNDKLFKEEIFCSLDSSEALSFPTDRLVETHNRWFDKKFWFRKIALELGYNLLPAGYIRYRPQELSEEWLDKTLIQFNTPYYIVDRSREEHERSIIILRSELCSTLCKFAQSTDGFVTVRVRGLPNNKFSGFSTVLEDGNILIEVVPGFFPGLKRLGIIPNTYIVDINNNVVESSIHNYQQFCNLNTKTMNWQIEDISDAYEEFSSISIENVIKLTLDMHYKLGEIRLEWVFDDNGTIYISDLSIENSKLFTKLNGYRVLSSGNFEGKAIHSFEISELESVCSTHTISVHPEETYYKVKNSSIVLNYLSNLKSLSEKPIIITRYPKIELALLIGDVSGFVFEEGSLLCHLGIMLREAGIPAVILPNAQSIISDQSNIMFLEGVLTIT